MRWQRRSPGKPHTVICCWAVQCLRCIGAGCLGGVLCTWPSAVSNIRSCFGIVSQSEGDIRGYLPTFCSTDQSSLHRRPTPSGSHGAPLTGCESNIEYCIPQCGSASKCRSSLRIRKVQMRGSEAWMYSGGQGEDPVHLGKQKTPTWRKKSCEDSGMVTDQGVRSGPLKIPVKVKS